MCSRNISVLSGSVRTKDQPLQVGNPFQ
ncbi:hypothetical protein LINPERPRIM_LOCUS22303 [Linum perenne]